MANSARRNSGAEQAVRVVVAVLAALAIAFCPDGPRISMQTDPIHLPSWAAIRSKRSRRARLLRHRLSLHLLR